VLEVHPGIAQALVLAHLHETLLGWSEAVLERANDDVGTGNSVLALVGPRPNCSL
jgi:hypothetical protein